MDKQTIRHRSDKINKNPTPKLPGPVSMYIIISSTDIHFITINYFKLSSIIILSFSLLLNMMDYVYFIYIQTQMHMALLYLCDLRVYFLLHLSL